MVGDPKIRLQEDQLRSLRAIRFATRYGFSIDIKTKDALKTKVSDFKIKCEIDDKFITKICKCCTAIR